MAEPARGGPSVTAPPIGDPNAPRALLAQLATAIRALTIVSVPGGSVAIGQSALFFPLVGLGTGALLALTDGLLASVVPFTARNLVLVALLTLVGGRRPLAGLARTATGLRPSSRAGARAPVRQRALGAAVVALVLGIELRSLDALAVGTQARTLALVLAPMLARWSIVALAFGSLPARPEGRGHAMVRTLGFREFGVASVAAFAVVLGWAEARGLLAILVLATLTIGARIGAHRAFGGITGDVLSGMGTLADAAALGVFALGRTT